MSSGDLPGERLKVAVADARGKVRVRIRAAQDAEPGGPWDRCIKACGAPISVGRRRAVA
jgi:hypothetical protein